MRSVRTRKLRIGARLLPAFLVIALCLLAFEACRRVLVPPSNESLVKRLERSRDRYDRLIADLKSDPRHDRWFASGDTLPSGNESRLDPRKQVTEFLWLGVGHAMRTGDYVYFICLYSSILPHEKTEEKGLLYVGEGKPDMTGLTVTWRGNRLTGRAPDGTYFVEQVDDHWYVYDTFF